MYRNIDENQYLIPLSRRHPFFYLEYCKLVRKDFDIRILTQKNKKNIEYALPVANIGALLLGPGCSITTEAARIASSRGCLICFSGGNATPLFLVSSQHRSPLSRIRQYEFSFDPIKRLECAKILFNRRKILMNNFPEYTFPFFPDSDIYSSIEEMFAMEGAWAKKAYKLFSQTYGVKWLGKNVEDDNRENPITFLNFLSYSMADIAIYHMGFDPNIGILHGRTKGGGLSYDLADTFKPVWALALSFEIINQKKDYQWIKNAFISRAIEFDLIHFLIQTLELIFYKNKR